MRICVLQDSEDIKNLAKKLKQPTNVVATRVGLWRAATNNEEGIPSKKEYTDFVKKMSESYKNFDKTVITSLHIQNAEPVRILNFNTDDSIAIVNIKNGSTNQLLLGTALLNGLKAGSIITLKKEKESIKVLIESIVPYDGDPAYSTLYFRPVDDTTSGINDFILHSGGAEGADTFWKGLSESYGINYETNQKHYYIDNATDSDLKHYSPPAHANTALNSEDIEEAKVELVNAAKAMYNFTGERIVNPLVLRDWAQVKYASSVFAVGKILNEGEKYSEKEDDDRVATKQIVAGGTGYAVELAIQHNKPVYVLNSEDNKWYTWKDGAFVAISIPILTDNFAGIGTRNLSEESGNELKKMFAISAFYYNNYVEGTNIVFKSEDSLASSLSNLANTPITYKEKQFRSVEHAYQTWKSGTFDERAYKDSNLKPSGSKSVNPDINVYIMQELIEAKLQQHPELVDQIEAAGGLVFLNKSRHKVNGRDKFWESTGDNMFMRVLKDAYIKVRQNSTSSDILQVRDEKLEKMQEQVRKSMNDLYGTIDETLPTIDLKTAVTTSSVTLDRTVLYNNAQYTIDENDVIHNAKGKPVFTKTPKTRKAILLQYKLQNNLARTINYDGNSYVVDNDNIIYNAEGAEQTLSSEITQALIKLNTSHISQYNNNKNTPEPTKKIRTQLKEQLEEAAKNALYSEVHKLHTTFDPITRQQRANSIAYFFSMILQEAYDEYFKNIQDKIDAPTITDIERINLEIQRDTHGLKEVIESVTPGELFVRVFNVYKDYVEASDEARIATEEETLKSLYEYENPQDLRKDAIDLANKKVIEYQKIINNFRLLSEEASLIIYDNEHILLYPDSSGSSSSLGSYFNIEGNTLEDYDIHAREESIKESWNINFREVSVISSLSDEVRTVIRNIPKLDNKGFQEMNDLMEPIYLDSQYVHAVLLENLHVMTNSLEMMPILESMVERFPWMQGIIDTLKNNSTIRTKFYHNYRKDWVNYWIQTQIKNGDGTYSVETVSVNKTIATYPMLNSWRNNYETGNVLTNESIYNKNSDLNPENAASLLEKVTILQNKAAKDMLVADDIEDIIYILRSIGIDTDPSFIRQLLGAYLDETADVNNHITVILKRLNIITSSISKETNVEKDLRGEDKEDLLNNFKNVYGKIARILSHLGEGVMERSIREQDKSYTSYTKSNYLGKTIKQLKNSKNDLEKFKAYLQKEFKDYDWFYNNDEWFNDWLNHLEKNPESRELLDHKVLLHWDKTYYSEWDSLDYTSILLSEYFSVPQDAGSMSHAAWYHVLMMSDAPNAEFIRFNRYMDGDAQDQNTGEDLTFQEIILRKLVKVVQQEFRRIELVEARHSAFQNGSLSVAQMAGYDKIVDKDGNVTHAGGSEFLFFPALNYKTVTIENEQMSFLDFLKKSKAGSFSTVVDTEVMIKEVMSEVMEDGFEDMMEVWTDRGLFETNDNGNYINLPKNYFNSHNTSRINKAIQDLTDVLDSVDDDIIKKNIKNIIKKLQKGHSIDDRFYKKSVDALNKYLAGKDIDISVDNTIISPTKNAIREYYYNSIFASSQIIQLTTTDLAFYNGPIDFQKRFKEIHSPADRLDTAAEYNGEIVGKDIENSITLADQEIISTILKDLEEMIIQEHKVGNIDDYTAANILAKFGYNNHTDSEGKEFAKIGSIMVPTEKVNVTDGQAYRGLESYRDVRIMSQGWNDDFERAYQNIINDTWTYADLNMMLQPIKPFTYTQVGRDSGVTGFGRIKTPIQHKNSEFVLFAVYEKLAGKLGKSSKLLQINKFMRDYKIDVVQFASAVKVGNQSIIDTKDLTGDALYQFLEDTVLINGDLNPNVVHQVPYEDYGIQTETPEHIMDTFQLLGTQIRKLIAADVPYDSEITINGQTKTFKEWFDIYNRVITENVLESFMILREEFRDIKKLEKILHNEIRSNPRYGMDLLHACTINPETGDFNIPLYDPIQSARIQALLNSIIKKNVTKQKTKGGSLIQVSNFGFTDDLKIEYTGTGPNKRIKYFEAYLPAYSKKLLEHFIDKRTGEIDMESVPEDLRRIVGYRIPTEDKYSMVPIRIKGFLPQQAGAVIILPAEITTISGSDFDVDKLYMILPEFDIKDVYDYKKIERALRKHKDFKKINDFKTLIDTVATSNEAYEEGSIELETYDLLNDTDTYKIKKVIRYTYDLEKEAEENSRKHRNNFILDFMFGVLTSPSVAPKITKPGNFDSLKSAANIQIIMGSVDLPTLEKITGSKDIPEIYKILSTMSLKSLNAIAKKYRKPIHTLSPEAQIYFHNQNAVSAKLIGIAANHNANHALMQHLQLKTAYVFTFNGVFYSELNKITNADPKHIFKDIISNLNATYLSAFVDGAKSPVVADLNINMFTINTVMLMSRMGIRPDTISLFLNQPIIKEITKEYARESKKYKSAKEVINNVITRYSESIGLTLSEGADLISPTDTQMFENILNGKTINTLDSTSKEYKDFKKGQIDFGLLFSTMFSTAELLNDLVLVTRFDSDSSAAGPSIADSLSREMRLERFKNSMASEQALLSGFMGLDNVLGREDTKKLEELSIDDPNFETKMRTYLNKLGPLAPMQSFYSLGIKGANKLLAKYFPQYSNTFTYIMNEIARYTKNGVLNTKTMNNIMNDFFAYFISNIFVKNFNKVNNTSISIDDYRDAYINNFPDIFETMLSRFPALSKVGFINQLKAYNANNRIPVKHVDFRNVGTLTDAMRDRMIRDWEMLLFDEHPEIRQFAADLFIYSTFRNGFGFGPNSFIHLASSLLKSSIPGYLKVLKGMKNIDSALQFEDGYVDPIITRFIDQYVLNHLHNRTLVGEMQPTTVEKLVDTKTVTTPIGVGKTREDKVPVFKQTFTIAVTDGVIPDSEIVYKTIKSSYGNVYAFRPFVMFKYGKEYHYYRCVKEYATQAEYAKILPLGVPNQFLEYSFNTPISELETSFRDKSMERLEDRDIPIAIMEELGNITIAPTREEDLKMYDALFKSIYGHDFKIEETTLQARKDTKINHLKNTYGSLERAFNDGAITQNELDFLKLDPNTANRDANDLELCAAGAIGKKIGTTPGMIQGATL